MKRVEERGLTAARPPWCLAAWPASEAASLASLVFLPNQPPIFLPVSLMLSSVSSAAYLFLWFCTAQRRGLRTMSLGNRYGYVPRLLQLLWQHSVKISVCPCTLRNSDFYQDSPLLQAGNRTNALLLPDAPICVVAEGRLCELQHGSTAPCCCSSGHYASAHMQ